MTAGPREAAGTPDDAASRRALVGVRRATLVAVAVATLTAVVVVMTVPLATRIEYTRLSRGWGLPVVVSAVVPIVLMMPWFATAKHGPADLPARQRTAFVVVAGVFVALMLRAQVVMAWGFLQAGAVAS
ncbi:hypothetical protein EDF38_1983 [Frigoribacterium sp. PhB160]|uniref:hypothetical protein n=1 Tax=Frigoribacterium sp. PhB160 TaxID=2485192 RepID=UPI000F4727B8|nr:hypothetical protein [Frigoribacterium sp. PhB160]ROS59143.1 hypothetical protein EDF38_1983 [Frigoribacterium sp. PhB160]